MDFAKMFEKKPAVGKIEHGSDATFASDVLASPVPVLVDFWATWCGPCRLVGGLLEELGPAYAGRMRIVKINVDENPATATHYGIQSIPTLILFKGGKPVDSVVGALPLNPLKAWFEKHLDPAPKTTEGPRK